MKQDQPAAKNKPEAKPEARAEQKPEPEVNAKQPANLTPQIARRAFELYEKQGHKDGRSVEDWEKAEWGKGYKLDSMDGEIGNL